MTLHGHVKMNAKKCLSNNWGKAIAIVMLSVSIYLLFAIIETIISMLLGLPVSGKDFSKLNGVAANIQNTSLLSFFVTLAMALASFLILIPLSLGITNWYMQLSNGESEDILSVFNCFSNKKMMLRALGLYFNVGIRLIILGILYLCMPLATVLLSNWVLKYGEFNGSQFVGYLGLIFGVVLYIVAVLGFSIYSQRYFLCKYYILDGKTSMKQAIKNSVQATNKIRDSIFLYKLSFLGWGILGVLILPMMYIIPYYSMTTVLYARFLMEADHQCNKLAVYHKQDAEDNDMFSTKPFETYRNKEENPGTQIN